MPYSVLFTLRAAPIAFLTFALLANCSSGSNPDASSHAGAPGAGSSQGGGIGNVAGHGSGGASGAGSTGGAGASTIEPSFKTVQGLIGSSCFGAGCHSDAGNPLQMEIGDQLYGRLTSYTTRTCGKLVDTARPTESALVKLLRGSCNGVERMPYGVCVEDGDPSCVLPEYIAAIEAWIAKGAPPQ